MMRLSFQNALFFLFLFLLAHLGLDVQAQKPNVQISGELSGGTKNYKVYLYEIDTQGILLLDSTQTNKKGRFSISFSCEQISFYMLHAEGNMPVKLLVNPGDNIFISASAGDVFNTYKIKGTDESDVLRVIDSAAVSFNQHIKNTENDYRRRISQSLDETLYDSLKLSKSRIFDDFKSFMLGIVQQNSKSLVCLVAISQNAGGQPLFTPDVDGELLNKLALDFINTYPTNKHAAHYFNTMMPVFRAIQAQKEIELMAGPGVRAPEIILFNQNRVEMKLSETKGKKVLLLFWNPACDKCREEIKMLLPIYERLMPKGFEIFAVSIGTNRNEWLGAMNEDKSDVWINVKIPEEGDGIPNMGSHYVKLYGIPTVPFSFLIDRDGLIRHRGIVHDALEETILKFMNE